MIKLRQGFGRLIRTQRDRGIVVILDPRVMTKPWRSAFRWEMLPGSAHIIARSQPDSAA